MELHVEIELTDLSCIRLRAASAEARQEPLLPYWATITVSDARITANFPVCSCTCYQESVRYGRGGANRTVQEAKALIIAKVMPLLYDYALIIFQ